MAAAESVVERVVAGTDVACWGVAVMVAGLVEATSVAEGASAADQLGAVALRQMAAAAQGSPHPALVAESQSSTRG